MNKYNYQINKGLRVTVEALNEPDADEKIEDLYPNAKSIELMSIIVKY